MSNIKLEDLKHKYKHKLKMGWKPTYADLLEIIEAIEAIEDNKIDKENNKNAKS